MSPRRAAGACRAGGLLLAFVLVVSQASAWYHAVAVTHVACLEHGEAIHSGAARADDIRIASGSEGGEGGKGGNVRADLATATGHDHCANAALLRWRDVTLTTPSTGAAFTSVAGPVSFAPGHTAGCASAVYSLAPKTSPPLSA